MTENARRLLEEIHILEVELQPFDFSSVRVLYDKKMQYQRIAAVEEFNCSKITNNYNKIINAQNRFQRGK